MKNRSKGLFSVKTVVLVMTLIIMVFSLFVVLPASLPSINDIDQDIFWACSIWGSAPKNYYTWTWDSDEQPTMDEWLDILVEARYYRYFICTQQQDSSANASEADNGILTHFHRIMPNDKGLGKLKTEINPENQNQFIISGYLQYGTATDIEPVANYLNSEYENEILDTIPEIAKPKGEIYDLLVTAPFPDKVGLARNTKLSIGLTSYLETGPRSEHFTTTTDEQGYFSYILEPLPAALFYEVTVSNARQRVAPTMRGQNVITYWENTVFYTSLVDCGGSDLLAMQRDEGKNRAWVFAGIVIAGAIFLLIWYLRHRKRRELYEEPEEAEEIEIDYADEMETAPGGETNRLEILFPQIEENLADVWGKDDLLEVRFRVIDPEGSTIPDIECAIEWGDGTSKTIISDATGEAERSHTYTEKGEFSITGSYTDPETHEKPSSWRIIRIVDYREEMVRLFNRMIYVLNIDTIPINNRMTAREVERILAPILEGVPDEVLQAVIAGFEEANYSIHAISRESYISMYLATKEVIDFGRQEQQQTEDTPE